MNKSYTVLTGAKVTATGPTALASASGSAFQEDKGSSGTSASAQKAGDRRGALAASHPQTEGER